MTPKVRESTCVSLRESVRSICGSREQVARIPGPILHLHPAPRPGPGFAPGGRRGPTRELLWWGGGGLGTLMLRGRSVAFHHAEDVLEKCKKQNFRGGGISYALKPFRSCSPGV